MNTVDKISIPGSDHAPTAEATSSSDTLPFPDHGRENFLRQWKYQFRKANEGYAACGKTLRKMNEMISSVAMFTESNK